MNVMEDFCLLCSESCRTHAILSMMIASQLVPSTILYLSTPSVADNRDRKVFETTLFNNTIKLDNLEKFHNSEVVHLNVSTPNDLRVIGELEKLRKKYIIFSLPGYILGKDYFSLPTKYIHVHPGKLPFYRGSTPFYYSVLKEGTISASAIFLEPKIDQGPVLMSMDFLAPPPGVSIDLEYDPWMRSILLKELLIFYQKEGNFPSAQVPPEKGEDYYIIHPTLKALAINKMAHSYRRFI